MKITLFGITIEIFFIITKDFEKAFDFHFAIYQAEMRNLVACESCKWVGTKADYQLHHIETGH